MIISSLYDVSNYNIDIYYGNILIVSKLLKCNIEVV